MQLELFVFFSLCFSFVCSSLHQLIHSYPSPASVVPFMLSGHHLYIFLEKEPSPAVLGIIDKNFAIFPYQIHYVRMKGTMEDYVNRRAAMHDKRERLVSPFMIFEGQISAYGEWCFRVVFDPEFTPDRIQFVCSEQGLSRIALTGIVGNRTSEELLEQAMETSDGIFR